MPVTTVRWDDKHEYPIERALEMHRDGSAFEQGSPFPLAFVQAAVKASDPRDFLSPSSMKSCPRQFVLKQKVDYALDLESMEAPLKGTAFHALLEKNLRGEPGFELEQRVARAIEVPVDGEVYILELSGQPDVVDIQNDTIEDYKTTGAYLRKDFNGYDSHRVQLGIYAWLLRPRNPDLRYGRLYYFGNKQRKLIRFELMSDDEAEAVIRKYAPEYIRWLKDRSYLPPIPTDPELLTFCKFCPVRQACDAFDQMGVTQVGDS
jgi:CRISPR/Cas system-associated exonuclease Cas4 (RecB family)